MSDEYGSDFISITDEDGKEYELEVLAELEKNVASWLSEHGAAEARKRSAGEALLLRQQESARMHALTDGLGSRRIAEKLIQISDGACSGRKDRQQTGGMK